MPITRLLLTTAALTVAATVANAADMPVKARPVIPEPIQQASGYVEVYGGWGSTRFQETGCNPISCFDNSETLKGWVLGGAGRGNYWLSPNMSMQLDAQAEGISYRLDAPSGQTFNGSHHSYLIGGHLNWRNSQQGLLGVFAGAGDQGGFFTEGRRHVVAGGEAQLYWNQFTFYLQGGYDTSVGTHSVEPHAWFVRGTGRYFFTPNTMLEGTVLYANGEFDFNSLFGPLIGTTTVGFDTWWWEVKLEHRFASTPFAGFVKYRGSETKFDTVFSGFGTDFFTDTKVTDHRVVVGLKLFMGQNTLLSNDRQGATLDIKEVLPVAFPETPFQPIP